MIITIFKSAGLGVQDVAIAKLVADLAGRKGIGRNLNSYDNMFVNFDLPVQVF